MPSLKQTSFAGGLVSDKLLGKTDQQKYANGLRTCRNFWITRYGTAENRPGSQFIAEVQDSANTARLLPWIVATGTAYLLEFSGAVMVPRVAGARIDTTGAAAWSNATAYIVGNVVTRLGATYACFQANTAQDPAVSPSYWRTLTGNMLVVPTLLQQAWLADFQYVQQNDIMGLASQSFYPIEIDRSSSVQWTFATFQPRQSTPAAGIFPMTPGNLNVTAGVASGGGAQLRGVNELYAVGGNSALAASSYTVVATTATTASAPAFPATAQGGVDGSNHVVLTWDAYAAATGYIIYRKVGSQYQKLAAVGVVTTYTDTNVAPDPATVAPATAYRYHYVVTSIDDTTGEESLPSLAATCDGGTPAAATPNVLTWAPVAGASNYRVYCMHIGTTDTHGAFGFIGVAAINTGAFSTVLTSGQALLVFADNNITPDASIQPPVALDPFAAFGNPRAIGAYQQRWLFGGFPDAQGTLAASRIGVRQNFNVSTPISDEDAILATIASKRNDVIQHFVDLGKLIIHTQGSEHVANGNQAGAITPVQTGIVLQGSCGASAISPVVIGNTDLFVQARGGFVRDLRYEIQSTGYQGKDLTAYAPDLFANRTVVSQAWQQIPHSILWVALDDGTLLGCTYSREQDIWAWHEHNLTGNVEQVCVVPEATEDVLYLIVKRTINGATKRYIERLANRVFATIDEAVFCDSALSFDGRNVGATTMQVDPQTPNHWTPQDPLSLTSFPPSFFPTDVGRTMVFQQVTTEVTYDADGVRIPVGTVTDQVTFTLITYLSANAMTVQSDKDVPTWAQGAATTTWGWADKTFSGLDHLEGETVVGLGDGDVMAAKVVTGGAITTDVPYLRLTVGLPIQADLQTLPIENTQGETIMNKKATVAELTANFYQTRGGTYGQDAEHLDEWVQRQDEAWSDPVGLFTGPVRIPVQGAWQTTAQLWIRQTDPLPIGISALVVSASIAN